MKKNIILIILSIIFGVLFTFFVLNKENTYAKEEYLVYAFQTGAFEKKEYAIKYSENFPSSIIIQDEELYKIYVAIYKDIDLINEMVVYFEDKNINVYLKSIKVNKDFYNLLNDYELLVKKSKDKNMYNNINQSILNSYLESNGYENIY